MFANQRPGISLENKSDERSVEIYEPASTQAFKVRVIWQSLEIMRQDKTFYFRLVSETRITYSSSVSK